MMIPTIFINFEHFRLFLYSNIYICISFIYKKFDKDSLLYEDYMNQGKIGQRN